MAEARRRGERSLYVAFEESQSEIVRNMKSIGIDLAPIVARDILRFHISRPTAYGLEMHQPEWMADLIARYDLRDPFA